MSLAQNIWQAANQARAPLDVTVNLSALARRIRLRVPTIWGYHHGKVAWPADTWLAAMLLTGAAKLQDDVLVIKLPDGIRPAFSFAEDTLRRLMAHETGDRVS